MIKGYFAHPRREMLEYVPIGVKAVLDVGCGEGNFGALLKEERGCVVWGLEPNDEAAEIARHKLDVLIPGPFEPSDNLGDQLFDCIVFNDVLEHLVDPWAAAKLARHHLAPAGVVVASIPNVRYFWTIMEILRAKDWIYRDAGILDRTHLRFFTLKSILRFFEETGFRVRKIVGINPTTHRYFIVLNAISLGWIADMEYQQFAVVAERADVAT